MESYTNLPRWGAAIIGALLGALEPAIPLLLLCTAAILADCLTAWSLSRRVARRYPHCVSPRRGGRFLSSHFGRVITTLTKTYALIIFAHLLTVHVTGPTVPLAKIAAGAVLFWQILSILENESSCTNSRWARVARRILIDKTERHFSIDLSPLTDTPETTTTTTPTTTTPTPPTA